MGTGSPQKLWGRASRRDDIVAGGKGVSVFAGTAWTGGHAIPIAIKKKMTRRQATKM